MRDLLPRAFVYDAKPEGLRGRNSCIPTVIQASAVPNLGSVDAAESPVRYRDQRSPSTTGRCVRRAKFRFDLGLSGLNGGNTAREVQAYQRLLRHDHCWGADLERVGPPHRGL